MEEARRKMSTSYVAHVSPSSRAQPAPSAWEGCGGDSPRPGDSIHLDRNICDRSLHPEQEEMPITTAGRKASLGRHRPRSNGDADGMGNALPSCAPTMLEVAPPRVSKPQNSTLRFRRPEGWDPEEREDRRKMRFWHGVKPARAISMGGLMPVGEGGPKSITMATVRAALRLKKRANVIHAKSILVKYLLDPRSSHMRMWKNWMLVNIMYTVLVVPWRISFDSRAGGLGLALGAIANISFVVDTILRFFTALETESGLLMNRREIAARYFKSWFVLDVITCIPFTTLLRDVVPPSVRVLTPVRGLRLLSLLKVVKVYAMHYEVSPVAMSIGKTLVTVILAAHLLSCLWFWVSCYDALKEGNPKTWEQCGSPDSVASQYLSSFYFIIYTMMTVGYGDQHADPSSKKGLILSVVIQLTGATLFGFIIAATRRIVQFIAPIQKATTTNIQKIAEYSVDRRLPPGVSSRIKRHFRYFYFKTSVFDERAVMQDVPWQLCQEVVAKTHRVALSATSLLQEGAFAPVVLMQLARAMKPMELDTSDEPIRQGDMVLQVFFVTMGRIEAYVDDRHEPSVSGLNASTAPASDGTGLRLASYLGVWGPGSMWGLNNVLLGGWSEATFVAASQSELLWLDQLDLQTALYEHPEIRQGLERTANNGRDALGQALSSETITKEGLKLKQISLTDFKAADLKQQLKHTDVHSLCTAASADKKAAGHARRRASMGAGGGVAGMVHDFQEMAAYGGRGVKGRVLTIVQSLQQAWGSRTRGRAHMRLVRTWRTSNHGFGEVQDWMGRAVKGVMETEETPEELNKRAIVLPDQVNKLRWDASISMICVLVAVLTPYRIAYALIDSRAWLAFDAAVDIFFAIGMIAAHYLKNGMILDVASTLPSYLFALPDMMFRGFVSLKLLRIRRVADLAEQLHRLSEQEAMSSGGPRQRAWMRGMQIDVPRWCVDVAQILIIIIYASHIFGCLWWVTSRYTNAQNSWWGMDGLNIDDTTSTYIASLYWAATTITTVGYGDLTPTDDMERAVACVTMVCGTTMFSYVIGSVSTLVMNPTEGSVRRNLELRNVEHYLEEQKVGEHLSNSVRAHMMFITGARSAWNEEHILSRLPPNVRERVLEHVHRDAIEVIPIFRHRSPAFVCAILRNLRPQQYSQGEIVYKNLQMSQGVYFVTKGIAEAYVKVVAKRQTGPEGETEEKVKGFVAAGEIFGYTRFLAAFLQDDLAVRASTLMHVYLLSNSTIRHLLIFHPFMAQELREGLEQAVFEQASEELSREQKKRAAREALYGGLADADVPFGQQRTSALTSYLRRESLKPLTAIVAERGDGLRSGQTKTTESRKKLAAVHGRKQGTLRGWNFLNETAVVEFSDSSSTSSEEQESTIVPGLAGVVVSQLTSDPNTSGENMSMSRDGRRPHDSTSGLGHPMAAGGTAAAAAAAAAVAATSQVDSECFSAKDSARSGDRKHDLQAEGRRGSDRRPTLTKRLAPLRHREHSVSIDRMDVSSSPEQVKVPTVEDIDKGPGNVGEEDLVRR